MAQLRSTTASDVPIGTGRDPRWNTPGGPVGGKTGTAEHGNDPDPALPRTWSAGYHGAIAFAVLVEEGQELGHRRGAARQEFLTNLSSD